MGCLGLCLHPGRGGAEAAGRRGAGASEDLPSGTGHVLEGHTCSAFSLPGCSGNG